MENQQNTNPAPVNESEKHPSWTSGENEFTHMSDEERRRHLGYSPGPEEPSLSEREQQSQQNAGAAAPGEQPG